MARNKARVMETIIAIAGEISPTLGKTIDGVNKQLGGISDMALAASAAVTAIGTAAVASTKYLADLGNDYKLAVNDIQASTGLVGNELNGFKKAMKDVYAAGFGDELGDVADGVSTVWKTTGEVGDALTETTKAAYALAETFDYDIEESARAAKAMMLNFGLSGEEAMGLIAAGAQNGLDFSGELIDNISEYSVQFGKLGFTADDMFNIFQEGADSGAWNLDKVGDAIKEFSIRAIDGSKGTVNAYEDLGLSSDKMMQTLASGGEGAKEAFKQVTKALMDLKDPVARDAAGVALFGTTWEDLGVDALAAMTTATGAAYDTWGAMDAINGVKYDNLDEAMEGIKRKVEVGLMPAAEKVTDAFIAVAPKIGEMVDKALPYIVSMAEEIGPLLTAAVDLADNGFAWLAENGESLLPVVGGLVGAFVAFKGAMMISGIITAVKGAMDGMTFTSYALTAAQKLLNGVMKANPFMLVASVIGVLVGAVIWLYQNWDIAKIKVEDFGRSVGETWNSVSAWVTGAIDKIGQYFPIFGAYLSGWWQSIQDAVGNVKNIFSGVIDFISNVFAGNWSAAWDNVVDIFGNIFGMIGNVAKAPINGVISIVNSAISGINGIGFDIPDWVPGIGGSKFALNIPKIPMLATGGFTDGVSIAGEAGTEAVISFDSAYRSQNLAYWAQAGRMLGALDDDYSLSGDSGGSYTDMGGVTFSPQITINGDAKKDDIIAAVRACYPEFLDMMEELMEERSGVVYA